MDELKDTQKSVFSNLLDPVVHTNPFGNNRFGERAYRRAERIVAGIILLTNHIAPEEDLRRSSRRTALLLLDLLLDLKDEMRSVSSDKMRELQASIRHLVSLLKMMVFGAFVSAQNAEIAIAALEDLNTFVFVSARSNLSDSLRLTKLDFMDIGRDDHKGHIRDIKDRLIIKDNAGIKDMSATSRDESDNSDMRGALGTKSKSIISILQGGVALNMPDIAAHLPEYGEKTIQRELGTLIDKGIVRRIGLRRWSKYSLNEKDSDRSSV